MAQGIWERYRGFEQSSDAYGVVVVLLVVLIILPAAIGSVSETAAGVATAVLGGAVGVLSLRVSRVRRWKVIVAVAIWVMALVGAAIPGAAILANVGGMGLGVLLMVSPIAILNRIVRHQKVSAKTVLGAVAVYLEIGLAFSLLYTVLFRLQPSAFPMVSAGTVGTFVYYSFVTLTTVGYGDITPSTSAGRTLAIFEALTGQIFLVVVVARIVALLGSGSREGRDDGSSG